MKSKLYKLIIPLSLVFILGILLISSVSGDAYSAETSEVNVPLVVDYSIYERDIVEIKFRDGLQIRLRDGRLTDLNGRSLNTPQAEEILDVVGGGEWVRSHITSETDLDKMRRQAEENTGNPMPDLNLYFRLRLPDNMEAAEAIALLSQLVEVERVYAVPRPAPLPTPPNYQDAGTPGLFYQQYLDAAPDGIGARYAWTGGGAAAAGSKICDVEYDWNDDHADLPFVSLVTIPPRNDLQDSFIQHGTAVLSVLGGLDNGWGVTGIAHDAQLYFAAAYTAQGYNVANAVATCANAIGIGDIILIEQQVSGPNRPSDPDAGDQTGLVPVEWYKPTYDAIQLAVALGRVVIEAAGNGGQNLDSSVYTTGNGGHYPFLTTNDSGAIIVGAGTPPNGAGIDPRSRLSFSNYGATVDVQGWGTLVLAAGYGDYYDDEGDDLNYTSFGGTSSASPIVAAAAAIVQSNYKLNSGSPALPGQIKAILQDTGTPQQGNENIGPLPNLKAAIEDIWGFSPSGPPTISPAGGVYEMPLEISIGYGPGQDKSNTNIRYTLNGSEPTEDSFIFIPEFGDTLYLNYGATVKAKAFQYNAGADRLFESDTASATYTSSTPKVAVPQITTSSGSTICNQPCQVSITTATPGATIRYRTDGRNISFFYPGTVYNAPFTLAPGTYDIRARAYKDGYYKSDTAAFGDIFVNPTVLPAPTLYPGDGDYPNSVTVYISSSVLGADIRYTLDGSTPTTLSNPFINSVVLTDTTTVKARVYLDGYTESAVTSATYTVTQGAAAPIITPNGGTATGSLQVSLSTTTPGATIRYTDNGAEPTSFSTIYTAPFVLGVGQQTVKAQAFLEGAAGSPVSTANFTVYESPAGSVADPMMTPFSTQYFVEPFTITMHSDTEGASIYYTFNTDGTLPADPTSGDNLYTGPIVINSNGSYRFKLRAVKTGLSPSNVIQPGQLNLGNALGTTALPTISPNGGEFTNTVQVTLSANQFEVMFYTKDGSTPVFGPPAIPPSFQYSSPINVFSATTIRANAYRIFFASGGTATANFTFVCDTPAITPSGGTFTDTVAVAMETGTTGVARIYYTTDGSEPTESDTQYTAPFTLTVGTYPVKTKCFKTNYEPSETALSVLVVNPTPVAPSITTQPISQTVDSGQTITFTSEITGTPAPSYQWQRDGINLAGEVEPVLVIPAPSANASGSYRVIASNGIGVITSTAVSLTVNPAVTSLSIAQVSHTDVVTAGERITYTLTITNNGPTSPVMATVAGTFSDVAALVGVTGAGCTWTTGSDTVSCTVSDVASGSPTQLTLVVTTNTTYDGSLTHTVTVTPAGGVIDQNPVNNSAQVTVTVRMGNQYQLYLPVVLKP